MLSQVMVEKKVTDLFSGRRRLIVKMNVYVTENKEIAWWEAMVV